MPENEPVVPDGGAEPIAEPTPEPTPEPTRSFEPFTERQQTKVNGLINETYAKAWHKAKSEFEGSLTQATTKIAELEAQVKAMRQPQPQPVVPAQPVPQPPPEPQPEPVKARPRKEEPVTADNSALLAQIAAEKARREEIEQAAKKLKEDRDALRQRLESQEQQSKENRIKEAFLQAAAKIDFYDPMDVFNLIRNEIAVDKETGQIVVLNAGGNPRLNSDLVPMTLQQYLSDFAKSKPHMVKAKNPDGGTGAGPSSRVVPERVKPDYSKMSKEEFAQLTSRVLGGQT